MRGFKLQMKKTGILLSVKIMSKNRQAQNVLNLNSLKRKFSDWLVVGQWGSIEP